jgi:tetratricopeptide (TPR) repeat protein
MTSDTDTIQIALKHHQAGQFQKAESICHHIIRDNPQHTEALQLLSGMALQMGNYTIAAEMINKAIASNPQNPISYSNLGVILNTFGKQEDAVKAYQQALRLRPDYAEAWNNLGTALRALGKVESAIDSYRKALRYKPEYAEAWNNLGLALKSLGKLESAIDSYRKALQYKPDYIEAHFMLACTKLHNKYDNDIQAMEKLLNKPDATDRQKIQLCFGLGKAFEDIKQYDKAFNYLLDGNRIQRNTFKYSISDDEVFFKKLIDVFDKNFLAHREGYGVIENTPIFILGMPRSGTTLVEQILSRHHQIHGAGELNDLKQILLTTNPKLTTRTFPEHVMELNRDDFTQFGTEYLRRISQYNITGKYHVTDKMPSNFLYIGMIRVLFPDAKIIHCKRDPVDTCLSCFKTTFEEVQKFAYDLTELGQYYRLYQKLMSHWHTVLPGYIYDIQYEELVAEQETQTRKLIGYCGLPWDEACLSFYKSDRAVKTASDVQVRRPIYKSSVQLWKRYEKHLGPLLSAFEQ